MKIWRRLKWVVEDFWVFSILWLVAYIKLLGCDKNHFFYLGFYFVEIFMIFRNWFSSCQTITKCWVRFPSFFIRADGKVIKRRMNGIYFFQDLIYTTEECRFIYENEHNNNKYIGKFLCRDLPEHHITSAID